MIFSGETVDASHLKRAESQVPTSFQGSVIKPTLVVLSTAGLQVDPFVVVSATSETIVGWIAPSGAVVACVARNSE